MPKFKNVSPLGALDLPLIGRIIEPGEVFEVTDQQATGLAGQLSNWLPVEDAAPAPTVAELRVALTERGLDASGKKPELIARLEAAHADQRALAPEAPSTTAQDQGASA